MKKLVDHLQYVCVVGDHWSQINELKKDQLSLKVLHWKTDGEIASTTRFKKLAGASRTLF